MSKAGTVVRYLEDSVLENRIKWRCKRAEYHCSTRDLKSTVALPASVVLANHEDPVVVFDKVGRVDNLTELSLMWDSMCFMRCTKCSQRG